MGITRRRALIAAASSLLTVTAACGAPDNSGGSGGNSDGEVPDKPKKAVALNVLDVAGNLQLTQGMIDEFVKKNPDVISRVTYSKSPAPELVGKIKAQQNANRVDIALVLTGVDGLAAGICAMTDLLFDGKLPTRGFVRQEQARLGDFLANRFGRYYARGI